MTGSSPAEQAAPPHPAGTIEAPATAEARHAAGPVSPTGGPGAGGPEPAAPAAPSAAVPAGRTPADSGPADSAGRIARPADALAELVGGNRRFVSGRPVHGHDVSAAAAASGGQLPHAVVLGCIDSRVPLEAIFDQTFGSICVVRSGGHVVDRAVLGSVGFAVSALNVPLIMVLGHVRCGAVDATVKALQTGSRPDGDVGYLVDEIAPAVQAVGLDDPDV